MPPIQKVGTGLVDFIIDYCQRHANPVNAFLHIFGVPMAFYGFFLLLTGHFMNGTMMVVIGYILQYLGHNAQGNEVGEVTLVKNVWKRLTQIKSKFSPQDGR
jgi:uncharacterized membrane protein YGL010W